MNEIDLPYFAAGLGALVLAGAFASIFTSLRYTGDAGLPRLIERATRHAGRLRFWKPRWSLLCKTSRLVLTLATAATFVFFFRALAGSPAWLMVAALFVLSLAYMLVARIVPHVLSESYADRISLAALPLVGILTRILYVFVFPLQVFEDRLLRHALSSSDDKGRPTTEDEIKSLIEESDEEDLEEEERDIIRSVFEFGDTVAREIMTPRIDISGIKDSLTVGESIEQVKESRHSRFPVYHDSIDDVIGMVHVKDLLRLCAGGSGDTAVSQIVKKIDYVPETVPLNDLLKLMKRSRSQMVLVVDEYGGTEGLVTMEDVIEELVGEIEDEYDFKETALHRRPDGSLLVQARMPISELNEEIGARFPESEEYDSLGGYVFATLGRVPRQGETLEAPGYTLRVHSATQRQIQVVQLVPKATT